MSGLLPENAIASGDRFSIGLVLQILSTPVAHQATRGFRMLATKDLGLADAGSVTAFLFPPLELWFTKGNLPDHFLHEWFHYPGTPIAQHTQQKVKQQVDLSRKNSGRWPVVRKIVDVLRYAGNPTV
jgi:hypothetical protein